MKVLYKHYKGKYYTFIGYATHSETLEEMIVYQAEYGDKQIWVRPRSMFFEEVKPGVMRFVRVQ